MTAAALFPSSLATPITLPTLLSPLSAHLSLRICIHFYCQQFYFDSLLAQAARKNSNKMVLQNKWRLLQQHSDERTDRQTRGGGGRKTERERERGVAAEWSHCNSACSLIIWLYSHMNIIFHCVPLPCSLLPSALPTLLLPTTVPRAATAMQHIELQA